MPRCRAFLVVLALSVAADALAQRPKAVVWVNCSCATAAERTAYLEAARATADRFFDVQGEESVVCRDLAPQAEDGVYRAWNVGRLRERVRELGGPLVAPASGGVVAVLFVELHRVRGNHDVRQGQIVVFKKDGGWIGTSIGLARTRFPEGERLLVESGLASLLQTLGIAKEEVPQRSFATSPTSRVFGDAVIGIPEGFDGASGGESGGKAD